MRTTDLSDSVWCNVLDVPALFRGAVYGTDDDVVVEVDGARWRIGAGRRVDASARRPDLVDRAGLGALLLGGVAPTPLAAGRAWRPAPPRRCAAPTPCSSSTPAPSARPVLTAVAGSLAAVSDRITTADVVKVARLARLALTADEIDRTTSQLGDMLDHFADIDELDLDDVEPMTQPYPLINVLRDDVVAAGLDRDEVLAAAPDADDGRFRVPPIIGLAE